MQTFTVSEAKTRFDELIDRVQRAPVRITRRKSVVGVMVSEQDYQAMRVFFADRLQRTLTQSAKEARSRGLTDERLKQLLTDKT